MAGSARQGDGLRGRRSGAPHGVRGAFRLRCFTEEPENVAAYGPSVTSAGSELFDAAHRRPRPRAA